MAKHFLIVYKDLDMVSQVRILSEEGLHSKTSILDDWSPTPRFSHRILSTMKNPSTFWCIYRDCPPVPLNGMESTFAFPSETMDNTPAWKLFDPARFEINYLELYAGLLSQTLNYLESLKAPGD
jgi:hypothetical protein